MLYRGVTWILHGWYGCHRDVTVVIQECDRGNSTGVLEGCYRGLHCFSGILQMCYKGVTGVFQGGDRGIPGCYRGVTEALEGCYKVVVGYFMGFTEGLKECYRVFFTGLLHGC